MRDSSVKNWISERVVVPVVQGMDKRMKRIVALASLFGYLLNPTKRNKDLEVRLSKSMDLGFEPGSLTLPMIYHDMVWSSVEQRGPRELQAIRRKLSADEQQKVSKEEAQSYATLLVAFMPSCLFYDTVDNIRSDIVHLFESLPFILGGAKAC